MAAFNIRDFVAGEGLDALALGMTELATLMNLPHLSFRQALFFIVVATANLNDRRVTMSDFRGRVVDDELLFGHGIQKSYALFLDDGLGWIQQVGDPEDGRRKFLELTPTGWAAAERIASAMKKE